MAEDPAVEARMVAISEELRCLVCQNESLAGSRAELANDLRREVRGLISAGKSDAEARARAQSAQAQAQDTDKGRIVVRRRIDDAPQHCYFPTHAEARSAGRRLRMEQWIAVVQYRHADGTWS